MGVWLVRKDIENKRKDFLDSIDKYIEYIDSYSQYKEAERRNSRLIEKANFCVELLEEYDSIVKDLSNKGISTTLEYCKGYFRILIGGNYRYRKSVVCGKGTRHYY